MSDKSKQAQWWDNLDPKSKTKFKKFGSIGIVLLVLTLYYYGSDREEKRQAFANQETTLQPIISEDLLEDDVRQSVVEEVDTAVAGLDAQSRQNEYQQQQIDDLRRLLGELQNQPPIIIEKKEESEPKGPSSELGLGKDEPAITGKTPYGNGQIQPIFPPAGAPQGLPGQSPYFQYEQPVSAPVVDIEPQLIGDIGYTPGANTEDSLKEQRNNEKKRIVRLPPSFMKASLLVGIDAMTSNLGESNPEPIILRVQAPAVLPNKVRQNLEGCFIVADAFGNLAKERVQVRLVSLHCNSTNGKAVIDQKIKGFVADTDGKRDLAGIVISKAGANMARAAAASAIGGFGESLGELGTSVTTTSVSTTTNVDTKKLLLGSAASGIGTGVNELAKIYTDLVKQATPTIEVGAAKELTVIIQETVDLEIKEYE